MGKEEGGQKQVKHYPYFLKFFKRTCIIMYLFHKYFLSVPEPVPSAGSVFRSALNRHGPATTNTPKHRNKCTHVTWGRS